MAAVASLGLFLASYIALILIWEDFTYGDDSMFTLYTLKGHNLAPPIWPSDGRFFPLAHQEFNLIRHFAGSMAGYHAFPILELLILSSILLMVDGELSISARSGLAALVLVTPAIVISFGGLVYDERNLVLCLACLALFVKRFEQTQSTAWAVAAAISAQVMIYYKETAFLLLLGFALGRLLLRCWDGGQPNWNWNRLRDKASRLDLCLALLSVLYLVYYVAVMLRHLNMQYADTSRLPLATVLISSLKLDILVWLFVAVALVRTCLILWRRASPLPLWDGLGFGGVAYFTSYIYLRMFTVYYLAPVDLIAVLYLGRFTILSWGRRSSSARLAIVLLIGIALFQDISFSAYRVFERKNVIHGKVEIARVVMAQFQSSAGNPRRIFFPFASPYVVMQFVAYLSYRGVPVEGVTVESAGLNNLMVISATAAKDGPCVPYEKIICHAASKPDHGDLVIILPDDEASSAETTPYSNGRELLLSYEPRPRVPQWLFPLVRHLQVVSYAFVHSYGYPRGEIPDRWLNASVTLWK